MIEPNDDEKKKIFYLTLQAMAASAALGDGRTKLRPVRLKDGTVSMALCIVNSVAVEGKGIAEQTIPIWVLSTPELMDGFETFNIFGDTIVHDGGVSPANLDDLQSQLNEFADKFRTTH